MDDDETGQCYPDIEPCYPGHLSDPDTTNCSDEEWVCEEFNMTGCLIDVLMDLSLVVVLTLQNYHATRSHMQMQNKPQEKDRY